ncbi:MAG TPA: hypothetical protein VFR65_02600 [Nitrososphaeraceae archaeon]|nr:hypothetical protein [Nitrososphaeraceae archaeon]
MQNIKKYSVVAILTLSAIAGIFSNIPLSSAHDTPIMANVALAYAQEANETTSMTNLTQTEEEEEEHATEDSHSAEEKEYNETSTVRDSVTELLQDKVIPGGDFIHLYDSTPYHILNGHVALKAPCEDDSITPVQVLIGSAPNMTAATLENVAPLSTPGEQCLYHADLIPGGNVTIITDIALSNPTEEDIEFPPTSTVVIGINEITKGEHGHSEK